MTVSRCVAVVECETLGAAQARSISDGLGLRNCPRPSQLAVATSNCDDLLIAKVNLMEG